MTNSDKYNFKDFSRKNYKRLLEIARKNYSFVLYNKRPLNFKSIYLRHDIDISVNSALPLAKIESELNIKSTYFLLLHSDFYNLFEKEISSIVKNIIKLGHKIGLHFDSHYYNIKNEINLEAKLLLEKKIIENIFDTEVKVFSFHNPNRFALNCRKYQYSDMINTYSDYFQKNVTYISDSNGYWRHKNLEDYLTDAREKNLQILLHPEWWQASVMSPKERIWRCIDGRALKSRKKYIAVLNKFRRNNFDW
ncbi:MAG: hypothetical protein NTU73_15415 [Ignavibacteriae bacterium]|nr:hypothetical protein [Ignavibacteriota bacterium]